MPRVTRKRTIAEIFRQIAEFQSRYRRFPTIASPFIGQDDSWNAIDGALRRDMIVQCRDFVALKAALASQGLAPSLARLNQAYERPRTQKRRFPDILAMIRGAIEQDGRFPLRTAPFNVPGYRDTWTAIDSALIHGAIADCPLWLAHVQNMAALGVAPSLATLDPAYRPKRRQLRSIAGIKAMILAHMKANGGKMPVQRSRLAGAATGDSWKAIGKALSTGAIAHDADRIDFAARLAQSQRKASLFSLEACYRDELTAAYRQDLGRGGEQQSAVPFAALISPLFHAAGEEASTIDGAASSFRLKRSLARSTR